MLGVSAYGMSQWIQTPKNQRFQRVFLLAFSGAFAIAGIARAVWPDDREVSGAGAANGPARDESIAGSQQSVP